MKEVLDYVTNLAKGKNEDQEYVFLTGNRINQIEKSKVEEYLQTMDFIIREMAKQVENAYTHDAYEDTRYHATELFMYVFDKTLETFYYTLIGKEPKTIFNVEEALDGEYYEISVPEELQLLVNKVVPRIVGIGDKTYRFMQNNGYLELSLSEWLDLYLFSALFLAQQFLLEQDLNE